MFCFLRKEESGLVEGISHIFASLFEGSTIIEETPLTILYSCANIVVLFFHDINVLKK